MDVQASLRDFMRVALLAEGVDRNYLKIAAGAIVLWSPSSRRAWIEIER